MLPPAPPAPYTLSNLRWRGSRLPRRRARARLKEVVREHSRWRRGYTWWKNSVMFGTGSNMSATHWASSCNRYVRNARTFNARWALPSMAVFGSTSTPSRSMPNCVTNYFGRAT